jgi:hypothetical protein
MKKYPKHYAPAPNEWVPHKSKMEWQCCDCALVHNVWFRLGPTGQLEVKMTRNERATAQVRKAKAA